MAEQKAQELCDSQHFEHERPDGRPFETIADGILTYDELGENLARGFEDDGRLMAAWQASATHNLNLMGEWDAVGVASVQCDVDGERYTVQHFVTAVERIF